MSGPNAIRDSLNKSAKAACWKLSAECILIAALIGLSTNASGQTKPITPSAQAPTHIQPWQVPSNVREYLIALGDRIQKPGKERVSLSGAITDGQGKTILANLVWEAPGRLRLDRIGVPAPPLIFDETSGLLNAAATPSSDLGILESLLNDSAEAFIYGVYRGHSHRFLGGRFRTDGGKVANYSGPWFDIYEAVAPFNSLNAPQATQKHFFFDSINKLHVRTTYMTVTNGVRTPISTEYGRWKVTAGQATPGQIIRKDNGVAVFTFEVTATTIGPAAADGLFPGRLP